MGKSESLAVDRFLHPDGVFVFRPSASAFPTVVPKSYNLLVCTSSYTIYANMHVPFIHSRICQTYGTPATKYEQVQTKEFQGLRFGN